MRGLDLNSWQGILTTLIGVALFALIGIGVRLLVMVTIQRRRERQNRQINERLRTLIGAYKVLGGSFTGNLVVDPTHLRDLRRADPLPEMEPEDEEADEFPVTESDRGRRIRDAVEAALSDIILLGTEEQVRLAQRAAIELVAGHPIQTDELVVALRDFIRKALDLDPIPADLAIPAQGPTRPSDSSGRGRRDQRGEGGRAGGGSRGGGGGGGGGVGGGVAGGTMMGASLGSGDADDALLTGRGR